MKIRYLFPALLLGALSPLAPTPAAHAFVDVSINVAPPVLPVYEQPLCPTEGYLWTPGYWGYADAGYYWVPGVWVAPPRIGFLWTPGYWGFGDGYYAFHSGYWGPTIGFYGGVNYGYGYGGYGYNGGRWDGDRFRYNTAITRVNTTIIHNTYIDKTVIHRDSGSRASFNGPGGITARPDSRQLAAAHGPHLAPTSEQVNHRETAAQERRSFTPAPGAKPAEARHAADERQSFNNHPTENRQTQQRPRDGTDRFLSPQEQDRANHLNQNVATERPITQNTKRDRGYENVPPSRTAREGNPYSGRPTNADPRATSAGREAKAERQATKHDDRQREESGKHDDRKSDKHDGQGY